MNVSFNTILIPVDFTINTKVAIKKALALCEGHDAAIHLLHVTRITSTNIISIYQYFANYSFNNQEFDVAVAKEKLDKVKGYIQDIRKDIAISTWVSFDLSIESAIVKKAKTINADIIIIGKNSHHSWAPFLNTIVPSKVAKKSGITVLTAKPGAMNHSIRTIVVPIGDKFPESKVAVIHALKKRFRIHVRLITFLTDQTDSNIIPASLLNAYRLLKNSPTSNVSYEILNGHNKAKEILRYCNKVHADILILNPETETKIGWLNKQMSDILPTNSKTQILAVHS